MLVSTRTILVQYWAPRVLENASLIIRGTFIWGARFRWFLLRWESLYFEPRSLIPLSKSQRGNHQKICSDFLAELRGKRRTIPSEDAKRPCASPKKLLWCVLQEDSLSRQTIMSGCKFRHQHHVRREGRRVSNQAYEKVCQVAARKRRASHADGDSGMVVSRHQSKGSRL